MQKVKSWMEKSGIEPRDVPTALIIFKGAGFLTYFSLTAVAVRFGPTRWFFRSGAPKRALVRFQNRYPNFYHKTEQKVVKYSEKLAEWQALQRTLGYFQNIKQRRAERLVHFEKRRRQDLGLGIAEGYILYKATLPIWASAYLCGILYIFKHGEQDLVENMQQSFQGMQADGSDPVLTMVVESTEEFIDTGSKLLMDNDEPSESTHAHH